MSILQVSARPLRAYVYALPFSGMIAAGLFFAVSMAPSLIPRQPVIQGMLSGFTAAVGFWFGLAVAWLQVFARYAKNADGSPLFDLRFTPDLLGGAALVAVVVGLVAAYAPARRAAQLDPAQAIRS
jgi:lipoprotein-releasing system permease protein